MLELTRVTIARERRIILTDVELSAQQGECLALLGASGAGKSTLLAAIAGLEPIAAGAIRIGGEVVDGPGVRRRPYERGIGMVFQSGGLWPHLDARSHLTVPLDGWPADERDARVRALVADLELGAFLARLPHELSGGEGRRLALARALAARPRLLLLDEPLAGVDALARPALLDLIARCTDGKTATVFVTHDPAEAAAVCARAAVVVDGRLAQVGTWTELAQAPANDLVARFARMSGR